MVTLLLAVSLGKAHNGMPPSLCGRQRTRTSPGYICEVAHPAYRERQLLGTHQWQSALLVVDCQSIMTGSKWAAKFPLA